MYIAVSYVDTGKVIYTPGEVIEEDYPNAEWHLKVGAIREATVRPTEKTNADEETEDVPEENFSVESKNAGREIDVTAGIVKKPARKKNTNKTGKGGDEA